MTQAELDYVVRSIRMERDLWARESGKAKSKARRNVLDNWHRQQAFRYRAMAEICNRHLRLLTCYEEE